MIDGEKQLEPCDATQTPLLLLTTVVSRLRFRTPVHWAVLNGRISALRILLDGGCSAFPPKPKAGVSLCVSHQQCRLFFPRPLPILSCTLPGFKTIYWCDIETPLEMCLRLYGDTEKGREIGHLLQSAKY